MKRLINFYFFRFHKNLTETKKLAFVENSQFTKLSFVRTLKYSRNFFLTFSKTLFLELKDVRCTGGSNSCANYSRNVL